jgi:hypothetical protein
MKNLINTRFQKYTDKNSGIYCIFAGLLLAGTVACGGGGGKNNPPPPPPAISLEYENPPTSDYVLVKNDILSSPAKVVLELRGPAIFGRGVSFGIELDASKATFAKVEAADPEYARNAVFDLGAVGPKLFKGVVDSSNTLRVSIAQKGTAASAKPLDGPLALIAIELKPNVPQNTTIALRPKDARILPASSGSAPITIVAGTLVAK